MKKLFFLILLSFFFSLNSEGQKAKLQLYDIKIVNDSLLILLKFKNKSDRPLNVYTPEFEDACSQLMRIYIVDKKNEEKYQLMPCDEIYNIDSVELPCESSLILPSQESYFIDLKYPLNDFVPHLRRGCYTFHLKLDYKYLVTDCNIAPLLDEILELKEDFNLDFKIRR